mmetsp:Transcript_33195/g.79473  ORF Transcript_33195/g.79473 Transcript_33195/m.79473 type:complete len:285 (-) Transcript_33195:287-1141(-)
MPAVRSPAAHHAALHVAGAHDLLAHLVPEVSVTLQLAVATQHEEAPEVVPLDGVPEGRAEVHSLAALAALIERCWARMLPVKQQELILRWAPLHVVYRPAIRRRDQRGLFSIRAEEVEAGLFVVGLPGVAVLGGRSHQHGGAHVVPGHGDGLRLVEVLRSCGPGGIVEPKDLAARGLALGLPDADGHVGRATAPGACAFGRHLEGDDSWRLDLGLSLPVAVAGHNLHAVLHHATAVGLQLRPLERRPGHYRHVLQGEREPHLACFCIPHPHVVPAVLLPSLVGD